MDAIIRLKQWKKRLRYVANGEVNVKAGSRRPRRLSARSVIAARGSTISPLHAQCRAHRTIFDSFGNNIKVKSSTEELSAGRVESVLPRKPAPQPTRKHGIHLEIPPGPSNGSPFAAEGPTLGNTITPTETIDSQSAFSFLALVQANDESTTTVQNDGLASQDTAIKSWGQLVSTFKVAIRRRKTQW